MCGCTQAPEAGQTFSIFGRAVFAHLDHLFAGQNIVIRTDMDPKETLHFGILTAEHICGFNDAAVPKTVADADLGNRFRDRTTGHNDLRIRCETADIHTGDRSQEHHQWITNQVLAECESRNGRVRKRNKDSMDACEYVLQTDECHTNPRSDETHGIDEIHDEITESFEQTLYTTGDRLHL